MLFIQGVFYIPSHCDINRVLNIVQEDSRSGTRLLLKDWHLNGKSVMKKR